jgi:hypothetical protein
MKWFKNLSRDNILYSGLIVTFIILYGATAFVSWYHAIDLFLIGNAIMLAIILSFVAEIGQASALFSILLTKNKHKFLTWSVMIILTTLQVIGNVYATYDYITIHNSAGVSSFQKAILFFMPTGDPEIFKVIIAWILGALLPIIALSMTALVAQNMILRAEEAKTKFDKENQPDAVDAKDIISEVSKIRPTQEELEELEDILKKKDPIGKPPVEEIEINKNDILGRTEEEILQYEKNIKDEIHKELENLPADQSTNEVIPHFSDEEIDKMNQDEYEGKNLYQQETDDMDEDTVSLTPDIQKEEDQKDIPTIIESEITNTNGLVDIPFPELSPEEFQKREKSKEEEERLERLRAIARENSKKK